MDSPYSPSAILVVSLDNPVIGPYFLGKEGIRWVPVNSDDHDSNLCLKKLNSLKFAFEYANIFKNPHLRKALDVTKGEIKAHNRCMATNIYGLCRLCGDRKSVV